MLLYILFFTEEGMDVLAPAGSGVSDAHPSAAFVTKFVSSRNISPLSFDRQTDRVK